MSTPLQKLESAFRTAILDATARRNLPTLLVGMISPPNLGAEELELQKALQGGRIAGRITIPDNQAASLVQPAGRDWRAFHNVTLAWLGGIAVLGMLGVLVLYYAAKGRIRIDAGRSGRTIQRFNALERGAHWMTASSFIVLALSGLNLTFGRYLILPLVGPDAFATLTLWGKYAHNLSLIHI